MGIDHVQRWRPAPAVVLAVLMALAAAVTLGAMAGPASAQPTFTTCASCHTVAKTHAGTTHASTACGTCHVGGFSAENKGVTPAACASCHNAADTAYNHVVAKQTCAGSGCHSITAKTTSLSLKVAPTSVKVKKTVKFSGVAGPLPALVGAKVAIKVERKVGTKWVKMKAVTRTAAASGSYAYTYKTAKKGAHRVTASIGKTPTYTSKSLKKTFKVK
jgi:hypothetical protein